MKSSRSVGILMGVGMLVCHCIAASPVNKHLPDFTLTISTEEETVKAQKDMDISVIVTEKNISRHTINAGRPGEPGKWYTMSVILYGRPAPITERYRRILTPPPDNPDPYVIQPGDGGFPFSIKPGESQTFEVPLTAFFDLTIPGRYEITFSRSTDPVEGEGVEVKSNTITITVLPADDPPAQQ